MTLRDAGNLAIYLGAVAGSLTTLALLVRYTVVKPLERYIDRSLIQPLQQELAQVRRGLADHLKSHRQYRKRGG